MAMVIFFQKDRVTLFDKFKENEVLNYRINFICNFMDFREYVNVDLFDYEF